MPKVRSMLITGAATLLLCVALLEVHRVIAWIASGSTSSSRSSRHHRNRIHHHRSPAFVITPPVQAQKQKTPPTVTFLSTSDNPQPTTEGFSSTKQEHYFMHPKHKVGAETSNEETKEESRVNQPEDPVHNVAVDPTFLEEDLLSQHEQLESLLLDAKPHTSDLPEPSLPETDADSPSNDAAVVSSTRSVPHFLKPKPKPVPYFLSSKTTEIPAAEEQAHTVIHPDDDARESAVGGDLALESIPLKDEEQTVVQKETTVAEGRLKPAASIDRTVYEFNKNLINILYATISFVYPTSQQQQQQPAINPLLNLLPKKVSTRSSHLSPLLGTEYNEILDTSQPPNPLLDLFPKMVSKATSHLSPLLGKEYIEIQETAYAGLRFEQFYIFETVARIPYFAYLSVLHLRETLGDRGDFNERRSTSKKENERRIETMRTHYAQADNELHHLLIMEALGGNKRGIDRLVAHTMAFFYYWFVVLVFLWNEQAAYHLNEVVEDHAYKTYDTFLAQHKDELMALPVPEIARKYYEDDYRKNPYLFKTFCAVSKTPRTTTIDTSSNPRRENRPHELHSLYDVFRNVRDDEKEHWMSLCNLVQYSDMKAVDEASVKSTEGS